LCGLRMCQSAAMSDGTGSNTSGALRALGSADSCAKSRTLTPAARRLSLRSSAVGSTTGRSVAISVGTGEAGSGGWEEDGPIVEVASTVFRARLGRVRWGVTGAVEGRAASGDNGPLHVTFGLIDAVGRGESCSDESS
jgi:hypothetical protein